VDSLLLGYPLPPELRYRDERGVIHIERAEQPPKKTRPSQGFRNIAGVGFSERYPTSAEKRPASPKANASPEGEGTRQNNGRSALPTIKVYPYGVARNRLVQAAKRLEVPIIVVSEPAEADVLVTLRSYYRKRQHPIVDAENRGMSIFVLRANTINQMQQFLTDLFNLSAAPGDDQVPGPVLQETQAAIEAVLNGERWVELPPATAYIRRLQHDMARQANLTSHSYGKEPSRRVRIFRD
jgi:hypothetical protein